MKMLSMQLNFWNGSSEMVVAEFNDLDAWLSKQDLQAILTVEITASMSLKEYMRLRRESLHD